MLLDVVICRTIAAVQYDRSTTIKYGEKRMKKKIFSTIAAFVIIVSAVPVVFSESIDSDILTDDNIAPVIAQKEELIYPTAMRDFSNDKLQNMEEQISAFGLSSDNVSTEIENILNNVDDDMSDIEKALTVHDYMVLNYKYDFENYLNGTIPDESYTMAGLLNNKTGVCQAYADTYKYIMNLLNIDCITISSNSMNHAWNMIKIDGSWYHVDVTWDDPIYDRLGRVGHEYFLVSDNEIKARDHYGWRSDVAANDSTYDDYFWNDVNSAIICLNGNIFYVDDIGIEKQKGFEGTPTTLYSLKDILWKEWGNDGGYWIGPFSGLGYCNNRLYFNTPSCIYSINVDGDAIEQVLTPDTSEGYIYGLFINGVELTYGIYKTPNDALTAEYTFRVADTIQVNNLQITASDEIYVNMPHKLSISIKPKIATNKEIEWSVSNTDIASVSDDGVLLGKREGIVDVTAKTKDGSDIAVTKSVVISATPSTPVAQVISNKESGLIAKNECITLSTDTVNAEIYYTLDGTEPTQFSEKYTQPIQISESVTIKAKAFKEGRPNSILSEFNYVVLIPNSISASLDDYAYKIWGSGKKQLDELKFTFNNQESAQNTFIVLAFYKNGILSDTRSINNIYLKNGENILNFPDIGLEYDSLNNYQIKVFVWSSDYPMYPLGQVSKFNV